MRTFRNGGKPGGAHYAESRAAQQDLQNNRDWLSQRSARSGIVVSPSCRRLTLRNVELKLAR